MDLLPREGLLCACSYRTLIYSRGPLETRFFFPREENQIEGHQSESEHAGTIKQSLLRGTFLSMCVC